MFRTSIVPILLSFGLAVSSFPLNHSSDTSLSPMDGDRSISRLLVQRPKPDGWTTINTFGIMVRLDQRNSTPPCVDVTCMVHMAAVQNTESSSAAAPALPLQSRDLYKRDAVISADPSTGNLYFTALNANSTDAVHQLDHRSSSDAEDSSANTGTFAYDNADTGNDLIDHDDFIEDIEDDESQLDPSSLTKRKKTSLTRCGPKCKMGRMKAVKAIENGKKRTSAITKVAAAVKDVMKGATIRTTITWYTGIDLQNPYCDRKSHWTPTDEALIVAVTEKWSLRPHCGEFMEISTTDAAKGKENRKVVARVVDLCGGCKAEIAHADLSKAAFLKLYDLDVGLVTNLKMRLVSAPKDWSDKLYGPRSL